MHAPIIIWTFRRTGGTNLAQAIFNASEYDDVAHEPFNLDRKYGHVLERFAASKNVDQLFTDLDEVMKKKPLIKHCMELCPKIFNAALMEVSIRYGYKHLFLYREQFIDRLLSLNFAVTTNIWGKGQKKNELDPSIFNTPIDIPKMVTHEKYCQKVMLYIYDALIELEQNPLAISFENLYKSDYDYSKMLVADIFDAMNLNKEALTEESLQTLLTGGSQGTNDKYMQFPNSKEFVDQISQLPAFRLHKFENNQLNCQSELGSRLVLFNLKPAVFHNKYHLVGTLRIDQGKEYYVEWFGNKVDVIKNLPSTKLAENFPEDEAAKNARFVSRATKVSGGVNIVMDYKVVARLSY